MDLSDHADERRDQGRDGEASRPDRGDAADQQHGDGADHGDRGARRPVGDEARQRSAGDRALERSEVADALDQRELPARRDAADHNRRRQRADRRQHCGRRLAHGFFALVGVIEQEADDASVVDDRNDAAHQHQRGDADMAAHRRGVDHQELGDEAGERRQAHDGEACERIGRGRERHDPAEAGEILDPPPAGPQNEGARGVEEQGLHHRVIGDMQQRGVGRQRRADAENGGDLADLRDGREGEHPLELGLEQGAQLAVDQRQAAEDREQRGRVDSGEGEMRERAGADRQVEHLDHAEHAGLGEDARQRAGDRGRRLGMGERQPALQGDEPHLDGEAEEEADGDGCADGRRDLDWPWRRAPRTRTSRSRRA